MDIRKIKKLIEMIEESGIAEIEIREGEESVRISRCSSVASQPVQVLPAPAPAVQQPTAPQLVERTADNLTGHIVRSPMVGPCYRSPSAGAKPFVEVGQRGEGGGPVWLRHAMKTVD